MIDDDKVVSLTDVLHPPDPKFVVNRFTGAYRFLSNFAEHRFTYGGVEGTSEHHYNAAKTLDENSKRLVYGQGSPGGAKSVGQRVLVRPDWEDVKEQVMGDVLAAKFADPKLRGSLLATGDALLVEGNVHHDNVWGDCYCDGDGCLAPGRNLLGRSLMRLRDGLNTSQNSSRWCRVAVTGHRVLSAGEDVWVREELRRVLVKLRDGRGVQCVLSGMAEGVDLLFAHAGEDAGLSLLAYVPYLYQGEKYGGENQWEWGRLRAVAAWDNVLSSRFYDGVFLRRNDALLRDCDVLVAVFREGGLARSGTGYTLRRALDAGLPVVKVNLDTKTTTIVNG